MIRLEVPGSPTGQGRPRFVRATGRAFTPPETRKATGRVQLAWMEAGRPALDAGPLTIYIEAVLERPKGHYRVNGELSAAGERSIWPTKRPDLSNVLKLIEDALLGLAYSDDALIVRASAVKRWANPGEAEHTVVMLDQAPEPSMFVDRRRAA